MPLVLFLLVIFRICLYCLSLLCECSFLPGTLFLLPPVFTWLTCRQPDLPSPWEILCAPPLCSQLPACPPVERTYPCVHASLVFISHQSWSFCGRDHVFVFRSPGILVRGQRTAVGRSEPEGPLFQVSALERSPNIT